MNQSGLGQAQFVFRKIDINYKFNIIYSNTYIVCIAGLVKYAG